MRFALASALLLAVASQTLADDLLTVTNFDGVSAGDFTPINSSGGFINDAGALGAPGAFEFDGNSFDNSASPGFWQGWALSNQTEPIDVGTNHDAYFLNQYLAAPGQAASGNDYAIAFSSLAPGFESLASITLAAGQRAYSIDLTNTWYVQNLIQTGNTYANKFEAGDYFKLIIDGYDASGASTGSVDVDLADFRDGKNFILDAWKTVSLLALGDATTLKFDFLTTDVDPKYGPNTPGYVAVDNFTTYAPAPQAVPEPASLALLGLGVAGALAVRRGRK